MWIHYKRLSQADSHNIFRFYWFVPDEKNSKLNVKICFPFPFFLLPSNWKDLYHGARKKIESSIWNVKMTENSLSDLNSQMILLVLVGSAFFISLQFFKRQSPK